MTAAGLAHNGGKRKGAVCTYLETWHLDIEEFLELRKNTGDDRRRTHDMNTANWIPDLFMKRVVEGGDWTLFSPSDVPDLHDRWGRAFEEAYLRYEDKVARGELKLAKRIPANQLWRKMLSMLFETGHPWITFKDACNVRSPQQHVGTVHSSNLCTEITLNTSETEIAVCNLGSVNMLAHMHEVDGRVELDQAKLKRTITTAMRMLDNVIDINYYAVAKARNSNLKHRPVGLGIMGFQDCLHLMRVPYGSAAALKFADTSMEAVCHHAYWASTELAEERGRYPSYRGSLWDRGVLPQDTLPMLRDERGGYVEIDESSSLDWAPLRERIAAHGMRNSNCVAIAPTATISNIIGVAASIEPDYQNIYVKSNLSGEFTVVNEQLVKDLKALGLWDDVMVSDLKYFDGSLAKIDRVPGTAARTVRDGVRDRRGVDRRSGRASAEMDRPGTEPQHLHGGCVGQEAGRHVQARVDARLEDDVLPAHAGCYVRREIDRPGRRAQRRVGVGWDSGNRRERSCEACGCGGAGTEVLRDRRPEL
jgi:ribonucleoside-diphosphate reductase alpha chain